MVNEPNWSNLDIMLGFKASNLAALAWELLARNALVMGQRGKEDSVGRAALEVMPPEEVVDRCYRIAKAYLNAAQEVSQPLLKAPAPQELITAKALMERKAIRESLRLAKAEAAVPVEEAPGDE